MVKVLCHNGRWRHNIVVLFPWLGLLVGMTVALSARQQIRWGGVPWRETYLPGVLLFESLVLLPIGIYLFVAYPSWSALYLIESTSISGSFGFFIMLVSMVGAVLGFQLGAFLCRRRFDRVLVGVIGGLILGLILFFVLAGARLSRVTQNDDWQSAPGLMGTTLGTTLVFTIPLVVGGWLFLLVLFEMEGKKVGRARKTKANSKAETRRMRGMAAARLEIAESPKRRASLSTRGVEGSSHKKPGIESLSLGSGEVSAADISRHRSNGDRALDE